MLHWQKVWANEARIVFGSGLIVISKCVKIKWKRASPTDPQPGSFNSSVET